jgi:hypothetical protein
MVEAETKRFGSFFARTEARIVANRQAVEELHRTDAVVIDANPKRSRDQAKRLPAKRHHQPSLELKSLCALLDGAEEEDEQASQQTGSVTPKAARKIARRPTAAESRKRKRSQLALGDDDEGEEAIYEGADYSEDEVEAGGDYDDGDDVEYQDDDQDDDDDWAGLSEDRRRHSSPRQRNSPRPSSEESSKVVGSTAETPKLAGRRVGLRPHNAKKTKFDVNWDKRYALLVDYFHQYGNALIPQKWKPNPTLGKWASNQRYLLAKQRLPQSRYARLELLGFWDTKFFTSTSSRSSSSSSKAKH